MSIKPRLCLVEDDPLVGESLCERFELEGFHCDWLRDAGAARERLLAGHYSAVVCDVCLPGVSGESLFRDLASQTACLPPWLFITGHGTLPRAVEMMKLGAVDYIAKPFELDELIAKLRDVCRLLAGPEISVHSSLGNAPATRRLYGLLPRLAAQARVILLTGESGVGKEVIAREIHRLDPATADQPFIAVNCKHPAAPRRQTQAVAVQVLTAPRNGSSSSIRLFGQTGSFSSVAFSHAAGSRPLRRAVPIRL